MSEIELYFENDEAMSKFGRELQTFFPDRCISSCGEACSTIGLIIVEITTKVDMHEINEAEGKNLAAEAANKLGCRVGLLRRGIFGGDACGRYVASRCVMGAPIR